MKERVARWVPEPDLLNLLFGALVATVINVATALMLGSVSATTLPSAVAVAIGLGLVCAAVGGLALVATRCKEEAMLSGASLLTKPELRAQFRNELAMRANRLIALNLVILVGIAVALLPVILWVISLILGGAEHAK